MVSSSLTVFHVGNDVYNFACFVVLVWPCMMQGRAEASMLPLLISSTGKVVGNLRLWTSRLRQDLCLNPSAGLLLNDGRVYMHDC